MNDCVQNLLEKIVVKFDGIVTSRNEKWVIFFPENGKDAKRALEEVVNVEDLFGGDIFTVSEKN